MATATARFLRDLSTDPAALEALANEAKEFALELGALRHTEGSPEVVTYAPFTLFPTPVPRDAFHQALEVQSHFNVLMDKISQDPRFLEDTLASTIEADDFTARLFDILKRVEKEGRTQSIVLGINRSDYMFEQSDDGTSRLKQVEINTIAAGAFGVSDNIPVIHRHILRLVGLGDQCQSIPDCNSTAGIARALAKAWQLYGQKEAVILFHVENLHFVSFNHRNLQEMLRKRGISFMRKNFESVYESGRLDSDKRLFIDGVEVAVVFHRDGFMPHHYTEKGWEAKLMMERSLAVKCPDISTHLAGTKKVQQELARPGVLEKFFPDQPQVVEQIRATFTGLYTLDMCPEGDQTVAMALDSPGNFVLKPQREGGGNNFYEDNIVRILEEVKGDARRAAYILMERIRPKVEHNVLLRRGLPIKLTPVAAELGVFGAYVRNGGEMVLNEVLGHIMRTKGIDYEDGGISRVAMYDNLIHY